MILNCIIICEDISQRGPFPPTCPTDCGLNGGQRQSGEGYARPQEEDRLGIVEGVNNAGVADECASATEALEHCDEKDAMEF
ncbi:hypothetical protein EVAR_2347_1 [Eumeta japonica]|uniref:Uncharacterized protein n=1 Tax=Eumeta variegata TaxID=151549 RepID=A0A4C1SIX4_EUMVA|nr:hypothetical protein EVAR_2347_1 [Eumeta japonica]